MASIKISNLRSTDIAFELNNNEIDNVAGDGDSMNLQMKTLNRFE